jgi:AcrR family transcriptional regulator
MARTRNSQVHAVRRGAFVEAAGRLLAQKGYEALSVQDVLDEVGASKGAFYHYFASKAELVDAVVDRMADDATARLAPILASPELPAGEKLRRLFAGLAQFKAEQKDLVLGILRVWLADDNAIVREKSRRQVGRRLVPWLDVIVAEGIAQGAFNARHPELLSQVLTTLVQGMSELAAELWVQRQLGEISYETVERMFEAYQEGFERIVGARPGSLALIDPPTLRFWFG